VSWKWTRLRAVLVSLGVVHRTEVDVKLLAGGHAAVIFGKCKCRGSEPHAGSPRFAVVVFSAPSMGIVRAPGCTLAAPSFTTAGQTPTTPKSPCVMVQHACMRVYAGQNEEEESMRDREVQPSFSPLGTTGNSSMSFTSCA
jgi:hypothetical protein